MATITYILMMAAGLVLAGLLWRQLALRRRCRLLEARLAELERALAAQPVAAETILGEKRPAVIAVEILNPLELAAKESWFAGAFGGLAPALLRQEVYKRALKIMAADLDKHGVKYDLRVLRG